MIYTVTFNPSLDYVLSVPDFKPGRTNRTTEEGIFPGGKGLNVSSVLWNLGIPSTALGFTAGFTGLEIQRRIRELGFFSDFIHIPDGFSRINVKLKNYEGTEINGKGPVISVSCLDQFFRKLDRLVPGDILILAGSIPESLSTSIYQEILQFLSGRKILFLIDAAGELLSSTLSFRPFLIKPNHHELAELFSKDGALDFENGEEILPYAKRLQDLGARNVLVSLGGRGAVFLSQSGEFRQLPAPQGILKNAVGAGDSMLAGFLAGWLSTQDSAYAFRLAVASGSATAFSDGLASREEIFSLLPGITL